MSIKFDFDKKARELNYTGAKELLHEMYITKKMSLLDISLRLSTSEKTVGRKLSELGIPRRKPGKSGKTMWDVDMHTFFKK